MDTRLIEIFGVALQDEIKLDSHVVNVVANKYGYVIHPNCCTQSVLDWLNKKSININSTFYKNWQDVVGRPREELFIDQIVSYAFTYGAQIQACQNDMDFSEVPEIRKYKIINPITKDELYDKCISMVESGIALKQNTVDAICGFISDCVSQGAKFDIDKVKNKEAQIWLCDKLEITPMDKFSLIRYIYYKVTGETMIVKDKFIIDRVKNGNPFNMNELSESQLESLASIFYRYKPIFLGLKHQKDFFNRNIVSNNHIINRLRRMAKKLHEPMIHGFWERMLSTPFSAFHLKDMLKRENPSNFKIIQLIQAIRENRLKSGGIGDHMYIIRNGKVWFKTIDMSKVPALDPKYEWWDIAEEILYKELIRRLRTKACSVRFPEHLNLACPTSEKNFIGNVPFGSNYNMPAHNMIGIYWKSEWGATDLDLSFLSHKGSKIGWNSDFYNSNSIIYSGDMTWANPEASEVMYMKNGCPEGVVKVNIYNGEIGSKFILTLAQSELNELPLNYMIDPNTIQFQTEIEMQSNEKMIGFVHDNKLYLSDIRTGDTNVSRSSKVDLEKIFTRKANSFLDLKQLLLDAGFKERKRPMRNKPIELDLTDLKKDVLIDLFK